MRIVELLDSYTEVSPSGRGLHVWVKGKVPGNRRRSGKLEMYDRARYVTVTGHALPGYTQIRERQEELEQLYRETFGEREASPRTPDRPAPGTSAVGLAGDDELLGRAMRTWWFPAVWGGTTRTTAGTRAGGTTGRAGTCCTAVVSRGRWSGWCGGRRARRARSGGRRGSGRTTGRGRWRRRCGVCRRGGPSPPPLCIPRGSARAGVQGYAAGP